MTVSSPQPQINPIEALSSAAKGAADAIGAALSRLQQHLPTTKTTPPPPPSRPTSSSSASHSPSFPGAARAAYPSQRITKEELGRATWTLLHSVAASYPERSPSRKRRRAFSSLVHSLAELYPCADCAEHFAKIVDARPPEEAASLGKAAVVRWACEVHNDVNERTRKPRFDCSLAPSRWGSSGVDCDDGSGVSSCEIVVGGKRK